MTRSPRRDDPDDRGGGRAKGTSPSPPPGSPVGRDLAELARLWGVQSSYTDASGTRRQAPAETVLALIRSLGRGRPDEVTEGADLGAAVAARRRELAAHLAEPVAVAWEGRLKLPVRPARTLGPAGPIDCHLTLEGGEDRRWRLEPEATGNEAGEAGEAGAADQVLRLPETLPRGYHRLELDAGGTRASVLVVSAPRRAYGSGLDRRGEWGVFLPLYALNRAAGGWGTGDFGDLARLVDWTAGLGGSLVGTLPLHAAFLDPAEGVFDPSPYAPASRLFWNEVFLELGAGADLGAAASAAVRKLLASAQLRKAREALAAAPEVDYREVMRAKRPVLEALARELFGGADGGDPRRAELAAFRRRRTEVESYAAFRAVGSRRAKPWQAWEPRLAAGDPEAFVPGEDYDEDVRRYHLYVQFLADAQLRSVAASAREAGTGLYLDLPLGVHSSSYDLWRHQDLFARGAAVGAPPDAFFIRGQNWGFPPPHPERQRESGYAYLRAVLGALFEAAGMLRIDHVMSLHRLYWIPDGAEATDGAYVRYPAEELYAILCLESHRHRTVLVGENLGTVPPVVDESLAEHGIGRMWVAQFALSGDPEAPFTLPPADALACLDTHDTPTFPGFLEGRDLARRIERGLLAPADAEAEREGRAAGRQALEEHLAAGPPLEPKASKTRKPLDPAALTRGATRLVAASAARTVLVNLEDLWGEPEPQNEPGTGPERPNWRRKAALTFEELSTDPRVVETLRQVDAARRRPVSATGSAPADAPAESPRRHPSRIEAPITGEELAQVSPLSEDDLYLFNEGRHFRLHEKLGARPLEVGGEAGVYFAVWAPSASAVSVVGDFNDWHGGAHPLAPRGGSGLWEGFLPGLGEGTLYKYHVVSGDGAYRVDKADPFATRAEVPPKTASVVCALDGRAAYSWGDGEWMAGRAERNALDAPISIYEVHLGSWRRKPEEGDRPLTYREVAPLLAEHAVRQGYTHVELLPVMEHPFYGSWGYQTTGYFAPTSRYGSPQDFMYLVDLLHQAGIGVILDWVPSHFPTDEHGLSYFDGTHLYEHADPRQGFHPDWGSLIFNYGRNEVRSFLVSSAIHWLDRYHADGLRVDAVASMLYLDYSRKAGEWIPNEHGGRENLEALSFLRQLNEEVYRSFPDVQTFAEESTAWPMVSRPTYLGGLGFGFKWDMGWMHDTLQFFAHEPIHRKYHLGELTFRMVYAFTENFCLPLSHDEVVHGKGSLLGKMPGPDWEKFANLRLLYGYLTAQPGKKLLFMGEELAPWREWSHETSLDWNLLTGGEGLTPHEGMRRLVADLNGLYRGEPALHEIDLAPEGFEWLEASDAEASVLAFLRKGRSTGDLVACVFNFTPVVRHNYRLGVPRGGVWQELLNTDAECYWGSGQGNLGGVEASPVGAHGRSHSLNLTLPPLAAVFLKSPDPQNG